MSRRVGTCIWIVLTSVSAASGCSLKEVTLRKLPTPSYAPTLTCTPRTTTTNILNDSPFRRDYVMNPALKLWKP